MAPIKAHVHIRTVWALTLYGTHLSNTKVRYLDSVICSEQQVPRLDVLVHHPVTVEVVQSLYQLNKVSGQRESNGCTLHTDRAAIEQQ